MQQSAQSDFREIRRTGSLEKSLKSQLESELDRARPSDLIQRAERSRADTAPAEILAQELRRNSEIRIGKNRIRLAEVGMIQDVEHLRAKLEAEPFAKGEIAMYREVPLSHTEATKCISPQIAVARWLPGG